MLKRQTLEQGVSTIAQREAMLYVVVNQSRYQLSADKILRYYSLLQIKVLYDVSTIKYGSK